MTLASSTADDAWGGTTSQLWIAASLIVLFHTLTLRSGAPWSGTGPDLGISIIHGLNVLEGRSFFDSTSYAGSGSTPAHTQPMLYSVTQAFLFKSVGFDSFFAVAKVLQNIALFGMLIFFAKIVWKKSGLFLAIASVTAFGLSPFLFEFKEQIRSELYFGAVLYGLFWHVDSLDSRAPVLGRAPVQRNLVPLIHGVLCYVLIATKSIGAVIFPSLIAYDLVTKRSISRPTLIAVACGIGLYGVQAALLSGLTESGYADEFPFTVQAVLARALQNARSYYYVLSEFLSFSSPGMVAVSAILLVMSLVFFAIGAFMSLRRAVGLHDIFFVFYFAVLLVHETTSAWARYLLLFMPFFFYYAFLGVTVMAERLSIRWRALPFAGYSLFLAAAFASVYANAVSWTSLSTGPKQADFVAMANDIRGQTPPGAIVAATQNEWTHLTTDRRTIRSPGNGCCSDELRRAQTLDALTGRNVGYVLLKTSPRRRTGFYGLNRWDDEDAPGFRSWVLRDSRRFQELARHGDYSLYALQR